MFLPRRDIVATGLVAIAAVLYVLWVTDLTLPGMGGTRVTGAAILGLGFAASAVAVVPNFDELIHGNKTYLVITSVLGLAALAGGVHMMLFGSAAGLAVTMAAMVTLWAIATTHHVFLARAEKAPAEDHVVSVTRREPERSVR